MSSEEETVINRNTMKLQNHLYKALKQRDQYKTERDTLIDDLSWYKAKVSRFERENEEIKESHIKHITNMENYYKDRVQELKEENKDKNRIISKRLEHENEKLTSQGLREQCKEYEQDASKFLNLLSEISKHIGNEPSSSTYKYFRAKLDNLNITEDK